MYEKPNTYQRFDISVARLGLILMLALSLMGAMAGCKQAPDVECFPKGSQELAEWPEKTCGDL